MENIWYQETIISTERLGSRQFYANFITGRISVTLPSWAGESYFLPDPFKLSYIPGCLNYGRVLRFWQRFAVYVNNLEECVVVDCDSLDSLSLLTKELNYADIHSGMIFCISEGGLAKIFEVPQLNSILQVQLPRSPDQIATCLKWSNGILISTFFNIGHSKSALVCCLLDIDKRQTPAIFEILEFDDPFPIHAIEMVPKPSENETSLFDVVCISSVNQIQIIRLSLTNNTELKLHRTLHKRIDDRPTKTGKGKKLSLAKQPADIRLIGLNHLVSDTTAPERAWSLQMNGMPIEPADLMLGNPSWSPSCLLAQPQPLQTESRGTKDPTPEIFPIATDRSHPVMVPCSQILAEPPRVTPPESLRDSQDLLHPNQTLPPPAVATHPSPALYPHQDLDLFRVQVHGINYSRNVLL